jgi:hypothetical protein
MNDTDTEGVLQSSAQKSLIKFAMPKCPSWLRATISQDEILG